MIPLVGVFANVGLEGADDLTGELGASFTGAEGAAVVGKFRKEARGVGAFFFDDDAANYGATGGAGELGRSRRGGKGAAKEFGGHGALRRWAIDEHGDGGPFLEAADDFDKGKSVLADDDGFDAPTGAGLAAEFGEVGAGLSLGDSEHFDFFLDHERGTDFPIAEVRGDHEDALAAFIGAGEVFPIRKFGKARAGIVAGFEAEEVDHFDGEAGEQAVGGGAGGGGVLIEGRKEVLEDDFAAARGGEAIGLAGENGDGLGEAEGKNAGGV